MQNNHAKAVENYTDAFLWTCALLLFMTFFVLVTIIGFIWTIFTAFGLNIALTYFARYRLASLDR